MNPASFDSRSLIPAMDPMKTPTEVWELVLAPLSPPDLAHIACQSFFFLDIARPFLYRSLILRSSREPTLATLNLLADNAPLAFTVRSCHFIADSRSTTCSGVILRALTNMSRLQCLEIVEPPFLTRAELGELVQVVSSTCRLLRRFAYHQSLRKCVWQPGELQGDVILSTQLTDSAPEIQGIKELMWDNPSTFTVRFQTIEWTLTSFLLFYRMFFSIAVSNARAAKQLSAHPDPHMAPHKFRHCWVQRGLRILLPQVSLPCWFTLGNMDGSPQSCYQ